jgi:alpha-1,3-rhamnosyl/mannosyltransferase
MNVAVNLLWSVPGVGGSEEYLARQLDGLARLAAEEHTEVRVTAFAPRGYSLRRPDVAATHEVVEAPSGCASRPVRVALENTWLARRTAGFDLVHHGGGTSPRRGSGPVVLTVHDVQWCEYPEYFSRIKLAWLRRVVPSSLAHATRIAVPSSFVAGTLGRHFGVDPARIDVVRHGLEPAVGQDPTPEAELRRRLGLGSRTVVVFPAITHPHKNHRFLLRLMASGRGPWSDEDLVVVFAGGPGRAEDELGAEIARLGLGDRVIRPGRVGHADRDALVSMAAAMVFPSLYEGFGAPVIEAFRLGTPVICSDRGSLPEVGGEAALVTPLDADAWDAALARAIDRRSEIAAAGRARADTFRSVDSARDLIECYRRAA